MSKTKEGLREVYERRERILKMIHGKPMSSFEIATITDKNLAEVSNDLSTMSKYGLVRIAGHKGARYTRGDSRKVSLWESLSTPSADEIEDISYFKKEEKLVLPKLPSGLLLMMGYTDHKPTGGRLVNNANFNPSHQLRKMEITIGNHWGIMMEASQ